MSTSLFRRDCSTVNSSLNLLSVLPVYFLYEPFTLLLVLPVTMTSSPVLSLTILFIGLVYTYRRTFGVIPKPKVYTLLLHGQRPLPTFTCYHLRQPPPPSRSTTKLIFRCVIRYEPGPTITLSITINRPKYNRDFDPGILNRVLCCFRSEIGSVQPLSGCMGGRPVV